MQLIHRLWMKISAFCRAFHRSTPLSTGVEDGRAVVGSANAEVPRAAISGTDPALLTVENLGRERSVYTRRSPHEDRLHTT